MEPATNCRRLRAVGGPTTVLKTSR